MRILFISNFYPPYELGGMEQLCQEAVDGLQSRGHVCHVLTSRYGLNSQPPAEPGITRSLYLQADIHYYQPLDFFLHRRGQEKANERALRDALDAFQPNIIFIWGMWNLSPRVARWAEQWMPGRVAYNIGSYWPLDPDPHTAYWSNAGRRSAARVLLLPISRLALGILKAEHYPPRPRFDHVSCCSQYVVDVLTDAEAIPPGAIAILNGIDPAPFLAHARQADGRNDVIRLIYFGGLMEHKGVHTAIEALGLLKQWGQTDRLHLTIVGGGQPDYEDCLRSMTREMGLENKVQFAGRVSRSKIPEILPHHDIFLFTSIWPEPFGRVIIEAMAAGLAVIGSDVGGSREILKYYSEDTLFSPGDAQTLASRIQRFLDEPDLIPRLGQIGQSLVIKHFTLDRMVTEIEAWLQEIVE